MIDKVFKIVFNCIRLTVFILLLLGTALGCSYYGTPSPPASYIAAKTGTIFIGRVISKSSKVITEDDDKYRVYKIKFKVEKALKGVDNETQEITLVKAITNRTSCTVDPPKFKKGEEWIIHKNFEQTENVSRNLFGGSDFYPYWKYVPNINQNYVEQLEKSVQNPVNAVYGHIHLPLGLSAKGNVEVVLQGNNLNLLTKTNEYGFYSFENIPAGNYKIQIYLPYKTGDLFHNTQSVFDPVKNTYNLSYDILIKSGAEYLYSVVSESSEK